MDLLESTIIFLGGIPPGGLRFRDPGPTHHARWMAKATYSLKMSVFRKQLRNPIAVANGLMNIAIFVVKVYVRAWFTATQSVASPRNDLDFMQRLVDYEKVHKSIAQAAQHRFASHLWYLSEVNIGFSVFDEKLTDNERKEIVGGILWREGSENPPKKRELDVRAVKGMKLGDLSTTKTMDFFDILGICTDFFKVPVSRWANRDDYNLGKKIATHLRVVNEHAERGVKLMQDYNRKITQKESSFQDLLVNVHTFRQSLPDKKKKSALVHKYDNYN